MSTTDAEVQTVVATASDEAPVYIEAGAEQVFGVVTQPPGHVNGTGVLLLHAGAHNLSSHKGGTWTRLCRTLAGEGYLTLRIDYHGTGDSSGILLDRSLSAQTNTDVDAAVDWLLSRGAERVVIAATCWGGLVGLTAAARHASVVSACLISPPLRMLHTGAPADKKGTKGSGSVKQNSRQLVKRHIIRLLLRDATYRAWLLGRARQRVVKLASRALPPALVARSAARRDALDPASMLTPLLRRKTPIHVLIGENEPTYRDLMQGRLPMVDAAASIVDIVTTPIAVHGLATVESQELVIGQIRSWLADDSARFAPTASRR